MFLQITLATEAHLAEALKR